MLHGLNVYPIRTGHASPPGARAEQSSGFRMDDLKRRIASPKDRVATIVSDRAPAHSAPTSYVHDIRNERPAYGFRFWIAHSHAYARAGHAWSCSACREGKIASRNRISAHQGITLTRIRLERLTEVNRHAVRNQVELAALRSDGELERYRAVSMAPPKRT
jgi:hypothetical protein